MRAVPSLVAPAPLTAAEQAALTAHERTLDRGQGKYFEIGRALTVIRDQRLYRQSAKTFEDYCDRRHDLARSTAYQLIEAAAVAANVRHGGQIPANERQARALSPLSPEDQRRAWAKAVDTARGRITAALVERCVEEILGRPPAALPGEVASDVAAGFAALPPEAQLEVMQQAEAAAAQRPARQVGGSDEAEREGQIERLTERLRAIHAGRPDVADRADVVLALYLAVCRGEDWAWQLVDRIGRERLAW